MYKYAFSALIASAVVLSSFVFATGCVAGDADEGGSSTVNYSPPDGGLSDGPVSPIDHCLNGLPDEGEMGIDCGGTCAGCGDGAPCMANEDCAHGVCIAQNGVKFGACYGPDLDGCIDAAVSPTVGLCSTTENHLLVCAPSYPTDTLGSCKNVGAGEHGEVYMCCPR